MASGGTELAHNQLIRRIDKSILDNIQIVSRPSELEEGKKHVLWMQDMPGDAPFLADKKERDKFDGIVFVSSWQQSVFNINMGVPFSESVVIRNAIEPIPECDKATDEIIKMIYHPTPHRGLEILVPVFIELVKKYDFLHLDVFSNFDIYGWGELNKNFENLYQQCRDHPKIEYHGFQPHDVVREAVRRAHIFSYPCIWRETSCMSAMEAMSAKCLVVAPNYGALPETLANYNIQYNWTEDFQDHAQRFYDAMCFAIENYRSENIQNLLSLQKIHADRSYSWGDREKEWTDYLSNLQPKKVVRGSINWM